MGLWRCQNAECAEGRAKENGQCIYDFEAPTPVCKKCGLDGREFPNAVIKLVCIHFEEVGRTIGNITAGKGVLACEPGKKLVHGTIRSGAPTAVTCPACKQTDAWRASMESHGEIVQEHDFPVEVDLQGGVIRMAEGGEGEPAARAPLSAPAWKPLPRESAGENKVVAEPSHPPAEEPRPEPRPSRFDRTG